MKKFVLGFIILFQCYPVLSQTNIDKIKSKVEVNIQDSVITFIINIRNTGSKEIGFYKNAAFDYCQLVNWPNCFSLQKKIGQFYYYVYPSSLPGPDFNSNLTTLKVGQSSEIVLKQFRDGINFPFENGEYLISFRITYFVGKKENVLEIENIPFAITSPHGARL